MTDALKPYDLVRCTRSTSEAVSGLKLGKYYVVNSVSTFFGATKICVTTLSGEKVKWEKEEKDFTFYSVSLRFKKVHIPDEDRVVLMAAMSLARASK